MPADERPDREILEDDARLDQHLKELEFRRANRQ
jgi:hypothetical protein